MNDVWVPLSNGDKNAVVTYSSGSPPVLEMLEGKMQPDCRSWVRAWCPTWELACHIATAHNNALGATT